MCIVVTLIELSEVVFFCSWYVYAECEAKHITYMTITKLSDEG